ncbi:hypothetical protein BU14_0172s0018 [Porphyra umbilicalis]|uniref:Serine aminopeptidase S33 domain-containing protein n=1 Tax=Porphyra umbilicalis TaxID=2786 RepID=A0A1X6P7U6_PORUM|nr:hypothetical protein BU14_0172s0018 [Porphyra umbilicalis]|eukprot:OSX76836.1 hypothetical protein BU14_0172s0018 [Porphyra umbilicalis]
MAAGRGRHGRPARHGGGGGGGGGGDGHGSDSMARIRSTFRKTARRVRSRSFATLSDAKQTLSGAQRVLSTELELAAAEANEFITSPHLLFRPMRLALAIGGPLMVPLLFMPPKLLIVYAASFVVWYLLLACYFAAEVAMRPPWLRTGLSMQALPSYWKGAIHDPATDLGLPFEDVEFTNRAGRTLRGWFIPPASGRTTTSSPPRPPPRTSPAVGPWSSPSSAQSTPTSSAPASPHLSPLGASPAFLPDATASMPVLPALTPQATGRLYLCPPYAASSSSHTEAGVVLEHARALPPTPLPAAAAATAATEKDVAAVATAAASPVAPDGAGGDMLVCVHGSGRDRRAFLRHAAVLAEAGYGVLLFDFSEHGTSDGHGRGCAFGTREQYDVLAAAEYLTTVRRARRVALIGTSAGAASALLAAAAALSPAPAGGAPRCAFVGVVAENPFTRPGELFVHHLQMLGDSYLSANQQRNARRALFWLAARVLLVRIGLTGDVGAVDAARVLGAADVKMLVMHGTSDDIVPYAQGELVAAAGGDAATFWPARDAAHCALFDKYPEQWSAVVLEFLMGAFEAAAAAAGEPVGGGGGRADKGVSAAAMGGGGAVPVAAPSPAAVASPSGR